jgi:dTDP-4-dehydrorhamnose reductase
MHPDVIINAAGYTAVDRAESEPDLAHRINAESVAVLAEAAAKCGAAVVHFSTDYIFDGTKRTPYVPEDVPNPQSVYAASKLAGERAVLESGAAAIILRTCWVYGMRGRNFVLAILKQAQLKSELRVVNDQVGVPTWSRAVAGATAEIVTRHVAGSVGNRSFASKEGVYHLACAGHTTWFDFSRAVFEEARMPAPTITPVSTAEYAAKAARPAYSVLDCSRTTEVFGVTMPAWREALRDALRDRNSMVRAGLVANLAEKPED